jgi:hypothetical protein
MTSHNREALGTLLVTTMMAISAGIFMHSVCVGLFVFGAIVFVERWINIIKS